MKTAGIVVLIGAGLGAVYLLTKKVIANVAATKVAATNQVVNAGIGSIFNNIVKLFNPAAPTTSPIPASQPLPVTELVDLPQLVSPTVENDNGAWIW